MTQKNLSGDKKAWQLVGEGKSAYVACPVPTGYSSTVIQGVEIAIPPEGYVFDPTTRQMVYIGVDKKKYGRGRLLLDAAGLAKMVRRKDCR